MGGYLILMGLLSISSFSFGQGCIPELLENVDFPGTDIATLYSPDAQHCQMLCTQHHRCLFFTFIRADWIKDDRHFYCYLKKTDSGEPNNRSPLLGVTSGYSLKPCRPCLSQVYQNVDFPGEDYRSLFTATYEDCQSVCNQDPHCQFFTFVNDVFAPENIRYKCHLKFSWTIPRTPIVEAKAGVISGFSHKVQMTQSFSTDCQGKLFPGTDVLGISIAEMPTSSPQHCQALCSNHPKCTYFSFNSNGFSCKLKNNPNEMVMKATVGVTSGLAAHHCQLDAAWVEEAKEGVDFRGSDISYVLLDDADACQKTCTQDATCQFYAYANEGFSNKDFWRRCYLKSTIIIPAPPKVKKLANVISGFSLRNCV
ncbi:coagulation factor XI-like [Brachionichthys hirsutus]|uniref:coagulation factor XI-like n=1 Tax=Brachionichthys hirsutus TaxID=412623 RepID=UPI003604D05C